MKNAAAANFGRSIQSRIYNCVRNWVNNEIRSHAFASRCLAEAMQASGTVASYVLKDGQPRVLLWLSQFSRSETFRARLISHFALGLGFPSLFLWATQFLIERNAFEEPMDWYARGLRSLGEWRMHGLALERWKGSLDHSGDSAAFHYEKGINALAHGNLPSMLIEAEQAYALSPSKESRSMLEYAQLISNQQNISHEKHHGEHKERDRIRRIRIGLLDWKSPDHEQGRGRRAQQLYDSAAILLHIVAALPKDSLIITTSGGGQEIVIPHPHSVGGRHIAGSASAALQIEFFLVDKNLPEISIQMQSNERLFLFLYGNLFETPYQLPWRLPAHVSPIFVSIGVRRFELLTPAILDLMRRCGPVGCQDRRTLTMLQGARVTAYSTASAGALLDSLSADSHIIEEAGQEAFLSLAQRLFRMTGNGFLNKHNRQSPRQAASKNRVDAEAEGRQRLESTIKRVVDALRDAQSATEFYQRLNMHCRPYVELSRNPEPVTTARWRRSSEDLPSCLPQNLPSDGFDVVSDGRIDVALAFDDLLCSQVPTMIDSLLANTASDIRIICCTRSVSMEKRSDIKRRFPDNEFVFIDLSEVELGDGFTFFDYVTMSTMDRLLAPILLPNVSRVIYMDPDVIVLGDVAELWRHDMGVCGVAARPIDHPNFTPIWNLVQKIANRTGSARTDDLDLETAARWDLSATGFNSGVLLLDLDRLRSQNFSEEALSLSREFGLNDNEALILWAQGRFSHLPDSWNYIPTIEHQQNPKLIHWAGPLKPWFRFRHVRYQAVWRHFEKRSRR